MSVYPNGRAGGDAPATPRAVQGQTAAAITLPTAPPGGGAHQPRAHARRAGGPAAFWDL